MSNQKTAYGLTWDNCGPYDMLASHEACKHVEAFLMNPFDSYEVSLAYAQMKLRAVHLNNARTLSRCIMLLPYGGPKGGDLRQRLNILMTHPNVKFVGAEG